MALNEEQIDKLKHLLSSSGWNDVLKPAIAKRGKDAINALCLSPAERKGEYEGVDDAVLRARIQECEWLLAGPVNEVAAFNHNRQLDELERQHQ